MKNLFKATILSLVVMLGMLAAPIRALAVPPPQVSCEILTQAELDAKNLSLGTIRWDDDLVTGHLKVTQLPSPTGRDGLPAETLYAVEKEEILHMSDMPNQSQKERARGKAQSAFLSIRSTGQNYGWWDCSWKISKNTKKKVVAYATVEYKSVSMDKNSMSITIKQVTQKKGGKWKTTFFIGDKSYSAKALKNYFA